VYIAGAGMRTVGRSYLARLSSLQCSRRRCITTLSDIRQNFVFIGAFQASKYSLNKCADAFRAPDMQLACPPFPTLRWRRRWNDWPLAAAGATSAANRVSRARKRAFETR
jgi:hypothetical protein